MHDTNQPMGNASGAPPADTRAAARVAARAPVKLRLRYQGRDLTTLGHTVDLSLSGMLVRGFRHFPIGSRLAFELDLQSDELGPLCGRVRVARQALFEHGGVDGCGFAFDAFEGGDAGRLESYIQSRIH